MAAGLLLGRWIPGLNTAVEKVQIDGISLPIAVGLLIMMYPVLAEVRYDRLDTVTGDRKLLVSSLVFNWLVGPALMFALAWIFLPDLPDYRTGLIMSAWPAASPWSSSGTTWPAATAKRPPCWSPSTRSSRSCCSPCSAGSTWRCCPAGWGWTRRRLDVSLWEIAKSVLIFLGIPLLAGFLVAPDRRAGKGTRLVRGEVPADDRSLGAVRPALHDRHPVRDAGRPDHQPGRWTSRASRCRCWSTSR